MWAAELQKYMEAEWSFKRVLQLDTQCEDAVVELDRIKLLQLEVSITHLVHLLTDWEMYRTRCIVQFRNQIYDSQEESVETNI